MVLGFWISTFVGIVSLFILTINIFHSPCCYCYFDEDAIAWIFGILEAISVFGFFFFGFYSGMLR